MVPEENRQYHDIPSLVDLTLESDDTRPDPSTRWLGDFLKREGLDVEPVPPAFLIGKDREDDDRGWPTRYGARRKIWMIAAFVAAVPAIGLPIVFGLWAMAPGSSTRRSATEALYRPPAASPGLSAAPIIRDVPIFPLPPAQPPPPDASAPDDFATLPPPDLASDSPAPAPPPAATALPPEPSGSAAGGLGAEVSPPPAAPPPSVATVPPAPAAAPKTSETASTTPPPSAPVPAAPPSQPVPVASAASTLPSGTPLRLSIAYDPARPETQMAAGELGKALQRALGDVAATDVVPTRTPASKVVYFFANDRDAAMRVADSLGRLTDDHAPVEMLRQASPPPPGTVQILLPPTKEVER